MAEHPITPPPELVRQWIEEHYGAVCIAPGMMEATSHVATQAARWGADQELEACCEWLVRNYNYPEAGNPLRTARRPKPPSLKEQALEALEDGDIGPGASLTPVEVCIIRRALEALPND